MRTAPLALLLLGLAGCSDRPSRAPQTVPPTAPATAAPAPVCVQDEDCVGDWRPQMRGCGPVERCVEGHCALPPAVTGVANRETGRVVFETPDGERSYQVELVMSPFETARGLMCRESMQPDWGMLFLMDQTRVQSFWMLNTLIPLDILFLDEEWRLVGSADHAEPRTTSPRTVGLPSRYVLELNDGEAARAGLTAGTQARFYPPRGPR